VRFGSGRKTWIPMAVRVRTPQRPRGGGGLRVHSSRGHRATHNATAMMMMNTTTARPTLPRAAPYHRAPLPPPLDRRAGRRGPRARRGRLDRGGHRALVAVAGREPARSVAAAVAADDAAAADQEARELVAVRRAGRHRPGRWPMWWWRVVVAGWLVVRWLAVAILEPITRAIGRSVGRRARRRCARVRVREAARDRPTEPVADVSGVWHSLRRSCRLHDGTLVRRCDGTLMINERDDDCATMNAR
jgi:hypothetical protein